MKNLQIDRKKLRTPQKKQKIENESTKEVTGPEGKQEIDIQQPDKMQDDNTSGWRNDIDALASVIANNWILQESDTVSDDSLKQPQALESNPAVGSEKNAQKFLSLIQTLTPRKVNQKWGQLSTEVKQFFKEKCQPFNQESLLEEEKTWRIVSYELLRLSLKYSFKLIITDLFDLETFLQMSLDYDAYIAQKQNIEVKHASATLCIAIENVLVSHTSFTVSPLLKKPVKPIINTESKSWLDFYMAHMTEDNAENSINALLFCDTPALITQAMSMNLPSALGGSTAISYYISTITKDNAREKIEAILKTQCNDIINFLLSKPCPFNTSQTLHAYYNATNPEYSVKIFATHSPELIESHLKNEHFLKNHFAVTTKDELVERIQSVLSCKYTVAIEKMLELLIDNEIIKGVAPLDVYFGLNAENKSSLDTYTITSRLNKVLSSCGRAVDWLFEGDAPRFFTLMSKKTWADFPLDEKKTMLFKIVNSKGTQHIKQRFFIKLIHHQDYKPEEGNASYLLKSNVIKKAKPNSKNKWFATFMSIFSQESGDSESKKQQMTQLTRSKKKPYSSTAETTPFIAPDIETHQVLLKYLKIVTDTNKSRIEINKKDAGKIKYFFKKNPQYDTCFVINKIRGKEQFQLTDIDRALCNKLLQEIQSGEVPLKKPKNTKTNTLEKLDNIRDKRSSKKPTKKAFAKIIEANDKKSNLETVKRLQTPKKNETLSSALKPDDVFATVSLKEAIKNQEERENPSLEDPSILPPSLAGISSVTAIPNLFLGDFSIFSLAPTRSVNEVESMVLYDS